MIPMKKTLLALALVAGLTSFAGNAKADLIVQTLNLNLNKFSDLNFQISNNSIVQTTPGNGFGIGGYNARNYQQGFYFSGFSNFVSTGQSYYDGYFDTYSITSSLLQLGSVVDGSTPFNSGYNYLDGNPFTGTIYEGFKREIQGNTYYGYIQGTGTGGTEWTLNSISFNSTAGASITVVDTTAAVPEPSTYALFGLGALALVVAYRRKVA
jgi:hypothetical protein